MKKLFPKLIIACAVIIITAPSCVKSRTTTTNTAQNGIKTFTGQMQCVWNESVQPNPLAFLDIDNGKVYDVNTAPAHAGEIDLIWSECSGGSLILSPNEYYDGYAPSSGTSPNFQTVKLFTGWNQRNQTLIDHKPGQTVAEYTAITNISQLNNLIGTNFDFSSSQFDFMECTSADFSKIYFVETTTAGVKKRGYIHFISGQKGNNNVVNFEIKIAQ
jgi:hypothetical protein